MTYKIWVFQNEVNEFYKWRSEMPARQVAKMDDRITKLSQVGEELFPLILAGTTQSGILKIKVHGNPQLRPLLCRGTEKPTEEYTLLVGAKEVGSQLKPNGVLQTAIDNKNLLVADLNLRVEYVP